MIPLSGTGPVSVFPVGLQVRECGKPPWQVRAAVQELADDDLLGILDKDDEMLACAGKTQIFWQIWVDDPTAIL